MPVQECFICRQDVEARRSFGHEGYEDGLICPICRRPACRFHLATVRWRWRSSGLLEATRICQRCVNKYEHRNWDVANRDWIT